MEQSKFKRFKRIISLKVATYMLIAMITIGAVCINCNAATNTLPASEPIEVVSPIDTNIANIIKDSIIKDSIQNRLVKEVEVYVRSYAPNAHAFIPKYLVQAGLAHDIDICFMMAQSQIETCYGTKGIGRETSKRSMFGVISRRYSNYEEAVNHYCETLKKYYLVKGKTEKHLMAKYTTSRGARYASNPHYEKELRLAYSNIKKSTKISELQEELRKL